MNQNIENNLEIPNSINMLIESISPDKESANYFNTLYLDNIREIREEKEKSRFNDIFYNTLKIFFQIQDIENWFSNTTKILMNNCFSDILKTLKINPEKQWDSSYLLSKIANKANNKNNWWISINWIRNKIETVFWEKKVMPKSEFLEKVKNSLNFETEEIELINSFIKKINNDKITLWMVVWWVTWMLKKIKKWEQDSRINECKTFLKMMNPSNFKFSWSEVFIAKYFISEWKVDENNIEEVLDLMNVKDIVKRTIIREMLKKWDEKIFEDILNEFKKNVLLDWIDSDTIKQLFEFSLKVAKWEENIWNLNFRVWLWWTEDDFPIRIFSYLIYVLETSKNFDELFWESPKVELFTWEEWAIECNWMDKKKVRNQTQKMFWFSEKFVKEFYPEVSFNTIKDPEWKEWSRISNVIDYLMGIIKKEIGNWNKKLNMIVEELIKRSKNHWNEWWEENALKYWVFHLICFQDIPCLTEYIYWECHKKSHIITVWWMAETEFLYIRNLLKEKFNITWYNNFLEKKWNTDFIKESKSKIKINWNITTWTWAVPPYYCANELDPTVWTIWDSIMEKIKEIFEKKPNNSSSVIKWLWILLSTWINPSEIMNFLGNIANENTQLETVAA